MRSVHQCGSLLMKVCGKMAQWGSVSLDRSVTIFLHFYLNFWACKIVLRSCISKVRFCEPKISEKKSKICFVTLTRENFLVYPKAIYPHYAIYPQTMSLIMTHPTARFVVLSFFFNKNISSTTKWFSGEMVQWVLLPLDMCVINIFLHFYMKFLGSQNST